MADQVKYSSKIAGKRVLIIGGSAGIGLGVAEAVLELGAGKVIISSSSQSRIDQAITDLHTKYPSKSHDDKDVIVIGRAASMGDATTVEREIISLLDYATENKQKKLDHIIYTAGDSLAMLPIKDVTVESLQAAGQVRFYGPVFIGKYAPSYCNPGPASSITFTGGSVSQKPIPNWSVIGSFATALHGLTRGLALDLKPLRVNLICPGAVETPLWDGMPEEQRKAMFKHLQETAATGKVGQVEDLVWSYLACLNDWNMTGSIVDSNSGSLIV